MKKTHKRQIHDYEKLDITDKEYYGIFVIHKRVKIDVKRIAKMRFIDNAIIEKINQKPRNTKYFVPDKISRYDYTYNKFYDVLKELKDDWHGEFLQAMKKIRTPQEVAESAKLNAISFGIYECDEWDEIAMFSGLKRSSKYNALIKMFYGQYIHFMASRVEQTMVKILSEKCEEIDRFSNNKFKELLKKHFDINLNEIPNIEKYNRFYALWNFLKHNSKSAYKKLKDIAPDMVTPEYPNGKFALWYVHFDSDIIDKLANDLDDFFKSLCQKVFSENTEEAGWNYDDYFMKLYKEELEAIKNPF